VATFDLNRRQPGNQGSRVENLDNFKILVFNQIERCNKARDEGKFDRFYANVDTLSDLLEPYSQNSNTYKATATGIKTKEDNDVIAAHKNFGKLTQAKFTKYRSLFRALMMLIHENDLLPEERVTYSDARV
jgi:deoxyadenosine/deoxycytidine kinase